MTESLEGDMRAVTAGQDNAQPMQLSLPSSPLPSFLFFLAGSHYVALAGLNSGDQASLKPTPTQMLSDF